MKKIILPLTLLTFTGITSISCNNNITEDSQPTSEVSSVKANKGINPVVSLPSKSLSYDESFISGKLVQSAQRSSVVSLTSDQMVVTAPSKTFIGGVYNSTTLDNLTYQPINYPVKPITVSYSFPSDYVVDEIDHPSMSSMRASIFKALNNANFSGLQTLSFDYNIKQFSYYSELKIAFGANVNIGGLLSIDISGSHNKVKRQTGIFTKFTQKNFTIDMDLPSNGNIFKNESDLNLAASNNPVYINSITYGRLGILSLESDYTYNETSFALKAALNAKVVNGTLSIDINSKKILEESDLSVYILGGKGSDAVQVVKGYEGFIQFIVNGGEFTKQDPGVPIQFSASHAGDNSVYYTTFTVNKD
ncbi:thiol-activated cytolysin family protein (plasmid) [Chryseobacterium rhizoplanae]|uniref:thiol-activated cytolysin family protein n=1 Tax=Chryseobacterium rhizoplanae TaxID=1609531 RepID=UPI001CE34705|nr:thiol-activated cytolysin family protein [Chryseobacterium rhizoplanae]UCA62257.1 thiol-activated cytolysin family protein [Chryseobacterium rhizoplanae]